MKFTHSTYPDYPGADGSPCPNLNPGFTLDVNAPLGEPNRLYVWLGGGWQVILGLPEFRDFRVTRREGHVIHGEYFTDWLHPHIGGCDRYRYHQDEDGQWVRNARPARGHWGWLTIDRRKG